jgi:predicted secreted Zn-dependent protease
MIWITTPFADNGRMIPRNRGWQFLYYRLARSAFIAGLVVVAGFSAPFFASSAVAETVITKSLSYFPVRGRTAADLDDALSQSGPLLQGTGIRHPGATEMRFGGTVTYVDQQPSDNLFAAMLTLLLNRQGTYCAVDSARITLDTKIILPRWTQRRRAGADLTLIWDTLSGDIKRHEERHAEIARQYARKLESDVKGLRAQPNCQAMEAEVARITESVLAEHDAEQARFDRIEAINFERRMVRLLQYRLEQIKAAE